MQVCCVWLHSIHSQVAKFVHHSSTCRTLRQSDANDLHSYNLSRQPSSGNLRLADQLPETRLVSENEFGKVRILSQVADLSLNIFGCQFNRFA
mgnify:CR=1 FL=1